MGNKDMRKEKKKPKQPKDKQKAPAPAKLGGIRPVKWRCPLSEGGDFSLGCKAEFQLSSSESWPARQCYGFGVRFQ